MTVPRSPVSDAQYAHLARRAAAGDEYAFGRLAERFEAMIRSTVWQIEGQALEDARQACLLGLWEACHAIHEDPSRHLPGAAKVRMRSRVRGQWRRSRAGGTVALVRAAPLGTDEWCVEPPDDRYDPARVCEARERVARVLVAFERLTPRQRDAVRRGYRRGESGAEQVMLHRAYKRLRELTDAA